jgi:hypothetical protein
MALTRRAPAAAFEQPKTTDTAAAPPPAAAAPAATPAAAPAAAPTPQPQAEAPKALVIQVPKSMAVANMQAGHQFMDSLKDALRVEWDTLTRMKANQGRIAVDKLNFGEWIVFSLMSWQDNWLVSPGSDTDEAKTLAKYSDDGKTIKDTGEDINEYMARLKDLGYEDARLGKRCVLAFELLDCDKDAGIDEGTLFQIDLAPTSRAAFERYRIQAALDIGKGRASGDDVVRIKAVAVVKTGGGNKEYTQLEFSRYKPA